MKLWIVGALIALPGCDMLFQLQEVRSVDAATDAGCGSPDEDGDCVADDLDNCAGIYNPSQANDSEGPPGDSVGDACDPQPTLAVDNRVEFWPFNDPSSDPNAWTAANGAWVYGDGFVEHTNTTQLYAVLRRNAIANDTDLSIEAGFTFTAWNETATNGSVGVWADFPASGIDGQTCSFNLYSSAPSMDSVTLQERYNQGGSALRTDIPALQAGDEIVVSMHRRRPDLLQCHVLVNGKRYDVHDVTASGTWLTDGRIAVSAGSASAKLRYVVTYVGQ